MADDDRLRSLMVNYQSGSIDAFDELYVLLSPAIRRAIRRQTIDAARVDDLVQETFLQMHRARHTYDAAYPVMPWVLAIARHVWLMHRRVLARRPQSTTPVEDVAPSVRPESEAYADRAAVRRALKDVAPERRKPLLWHHVWGFTFREIAQRLGIREDAAKLRSSRAMADMRRALGRGKHG